MLADTDAGNVVTGAQAGAQWGYRLLPLLLVLMPMLYMVQELAVRLGIYTGRGHGELIRERFGVGWAWLSTAGLAAATIGSLVTEFTGAAGIGELYGLSRSLTLPVAAAALLIVVATGSYRRVERIAIVIGLFELAFFAVAWAAHPNLETLAKLAVDLPLYNREFMYLVAAVIGAVFNPWMIFYQQAAIADKKLRPDDLKAARLGYGYRHGAYPVLDRSRAGRRSGDAGRQRCLGEPRQYRRDQQCADATSWRGCGTPGLQRRRTRRLAGGRHRVLAGVGLGSG
jgi:NRAMP (natural resistance-associated macrophage protein)-like metal ion transporter